MNVYDMKVILVGFELSWFVPMKKRGFWVCVVPVLSFYFFFNLIL
jgi:hypothetical protein